MGLSAQKFEEKLWDHFRNFASLSSSNPGLLVACNQVVELQELIDAQLPPESRKEFKQHAFDEMEQSISDGFKALFDICAKLKQQATSEADTVAAEEPVSEILEEAMKLSQQLVEIYDLVDPCFPAEDKIFDRLWRVYHKNFARLLDLLGVCAHSIDNKSILDVVRWIECYKEMLRNLGVEESQLAFADAPVISASEGAGALSDNGGLSTMIDVYIDRDKSSTTTWYLNILDSDVNSDPKTDQDDKLWTPGFVDFFRILNDAFTAVESETKGEMLYRSAHSALQMMSEFVAAENAILQRDVPPHILCAFTNNNIRSYDLAVEFVEHYDDVVRDDLSGKLEAEDVYRAFLDVANTAMKKLVDSVFADPGMVGLLKKLYQAEWQTGQITSSLVATLQDYLEEFNVVLDASIYKRVVEASLVKAVGSYTSALVSRMPSITEAVIQQMQRDEARLSEFYAGLMSPSKVAPHVQILSSMRQLACADSVEGFVFAYLSILDANPDTAPGIVEKVCAARGDITRADANEIIEQCRELFHQRQQKRLAEGDCEPAVGKIEVKTNLWNKFMGL